MTDEQKTLIDLVQKAIAEQAHVNEPRFPRYVGQKPGAHYMVFYETGTARIKLSPRLDLVKLSIGEFGWGDRTNGAAQLALAILANHLPDEQAALRLRKPFTEAVIWQIDQFKGWTLTAAQVEAAVTIIAQWMAEHEDRGEPAQRQQTNVADLISPAQAMKAVETLVQIAAMWETGKAAPEEGDHDDMESAYGNGVEVATYEIAKLARDVLASFQTARRGEDTLLVDTPYVSGPYLFDPNTGAITAQGRLLAIVMKEPWKPMSYLANGYLLAKAPRMDALLESVSEALATISGMEEGDPAPAPPAPGGFFLLNGGLGARPRA